MRQAYATDIIVASAVSPPDSIPENVVSPHLFIRMGRNFRLPTLGYFLQCIIIIIGLQS